MGIITLTTDLGLSDYYVAALKGAIYRLCPSVTIVDITHNNRPFDILEASYHICSVIADFPDETVHVIGVNSEPTINLMDASRNLLPSIMRFKNQFFIATNNGVFSTILKGEQPQGFWTIEDTLSNPNNLLNPTKSMLIPAACKLILGEKIESFTSTSSRISSILTLQPSISETHIIGQVIHIDHYGNVITNITKDHFKQFNSEYAFEIQLGTKGDVKLTEIHHSYTDLSNGEPGAFFNTANHLEIFIKNAANNHGNGTNKLLGLNINSQVYILFTYQGSHKNLQQLF